MYAVADVTGKCPLLLFGLQLCEECTVNLSFWYSTFPSSLSLFCGGFTVGFMSPDTVLFFRMRTAQATEMHVSASHQSTSILNKKIKGEKVVCFSDLISLLGGSIGFRWLHGFLLMYFTCLLSVTWSSVFFETLHSFLTAVQKKKKSLKWNNFYFSFVLCGGDLGSFWWPQGKGLLSHYHSPNLCSHFFLRHLCG